MLLPADAVEPIPSNVTVLTGRDMVWSASASAVGGNGAAFTVIVTDAVDENLYLAARNIPHVDVVDAAAIDPVSLIAFDKVVMSVAAAKKIEVELG